MEKVEYKNAIKNRKKMASAFLKLTIEKEKFTVTDLVKLAGVNRGTFYLHFKSLEDVGQLIENELINNFKVLEDEFRTCDIDQTPEIIMHKLNDLLIKDLDFYKMIICSKHSNTFMEGIRTSIIKSISNNFKVMRYVTDYNKFKTLVEYVTGGVIAIYKAWFNNLIEFNLTEMTDFCSNLIRTGLKGCINYQWK